MSVTTMKGTTTRRPLLIVSLALWQFGREEF
jgi:hypothetical protein